MRRKVISCSVAGYVFTAMAKIGRINSLDYSNKKVYPEVNGKLTEEVELPVGLIDLKELNPMVWLDYAGTAKSGEISKFKLAIDCEVTINDSSFLVRRLNVLYNGMNLSLSSLNLFSKEYFMRFCKEMDLNKFIKLVEKHHPLNSAQLGLFRT